MDRLVFVDHAAGISGGHAGKDLVNSFRHTPVLPETYAFGLPFPQIAPSGYEFLPPPPEAYDRSGSFS